MNKYFMSSLNISASGLKAQRKRLDAIASNIANASTTRTEEGGPYKRQISTFSENQKVSRFQKLLDDEQLKLSTTDKSHLLPEDYGKISDRLSGVQNDIVKDESAPKMVYNPTHPDSNEEGYVAMPNINVVTEMVDMISASRIYEANVTALNAAKGMAKQALMI